MELILAKVGEKDGLPIFSPVDIEDVKAIGSKELLCCKLQSAKSLRTSLQNRSIRLYCKMLSVSLNDAGYDVIATLKALSGRIEIPWSPESVLEKLWRPVQLHTYGTTSTTRLERMQVGIVYEALNAQTAGKLGVGVLFPDKNQTRNTK